MRLRDGDVELPQRLSGLRASEAEQEGQGDIGPCRAFRIAQQRLERDSGRVAEDRNRLGALPLDLGHDRVDERRVAVVVVRPVEADSDPGRARPQLAGAASPGIETRPRWRTRAPPDAPADPDAAGSG